MQFVSLLLLEAKFLVPGWHESPQLHLLVKEIPLALIQMIRNPLSCAQLLNHLFHLKKRKGSQLVSLCLSLEITLTSGAVHRIRHSFNQLWSNIRKC